MNNLFLQYQQSLLRIKPKLSDVLPYKQKKRRIAVLVAIMGARMNYAVPVTLEACGMLWRFYTDYYHYRKKLLFRLLALVAKFPINMLRRMIKRNHAQLSDSRVKTFPLLGISFAIKFNRARTAFVRERLYCRCGERFSRAITHDNWMDATVVYGINTASLSIFRKAYQQGLVTILEQIIAPYGSLAKAYEKERSTWRDWQVLEDETYLHLAALEEKEWQISDGILCGSRFVMDGVVSQGVAPERCYLVPYCVDTDYYLPRFGRVQEQHDDRFHVLFLGSVDLRKGVQYLYQALNLLSEPRLEVRIAGGVNLSQEGLKKLSQVGQIIGLVPRHQVPTLFHWADVFVFPSLFEGSALVTYESLACGVPVITTPNAGSVVRDGIDGYIVPVCDPYAIAERISHLMSNRELCNSMAQAARAHAESYLSIAAYAERLTSAIKQIVFSKN